jgi:hypothetical protein
MIKLTTISGQEIELHSHCILCNDITFPWEFNPHNTRLWIVSNEYGALGAVWAYCEQDALDELVDNDLGNGLLIDEADADEDCCRLGNAGEPANLDYCRIDQVRLDPALDCQLLCKFAEARGAVYDNLDKL